MASLTSVGLEVGDEVGDIVGTEVGMNVPTIIVGARVGLAMGTAPPLAHTDERQRRKRSAREELPNMDNNDVTSMDDSSSIVPSLSHHHCRTVLSANATSTSTGATEDWLLLQAYSNHLTSIAPSEMNASLPTTTYSPDGLGVTAASYLPQQLPFLLSDVSLKNHSNNPISLMEQLLAMIASTESNSGGVSDNDPNAITTRYFCTNSLRNTLLPLLEQDVYREDTIWALLRMMDYGYQSLVVQVEACKLLERLLDVTAIMSGKAGADVMPNAKDATTAVRIILRAMCQYQNDLTLQCLGLDLVRKLKNGIDPASSSPSTSTESDSSNSDSNSRKSKQNNSILAAEATSLIFQAHLLFPEVLCIQQIALSLLAWLVEDDDCRQVVIDANGIETVPSTMALHPQDAVVQCNSAATICWLIHAGGKNGRLRLDPRHIPVVLRALAAHFEEVTVFGNCVCLLCGFQHLDEDPTILKVISMGMELHLSSAKALESCLRWMRFRDIIECQEQLVACLPLILKAMHRHPNDVNLQAQAVEVLVMFADVPRAREALLSHGAVDAVLATLQHHKTNSHVQLAAIWFLTLLLPLTHPALEEAGGGGVVVVGDGAAAAPHSTTAAFGGGFFVVEVLWKSLGIEGAIAGTGGGGGEAAPVPEDFPELDSDDEDDMDEEMDEDYFEEDEDEDDDGDDESMQ